MPNCDFENYHWLSVSSIYLIWQHRARSLFDTD